MPTRLTAAKGKRKRPSRAAKVKGHKPASGKHSAPKRKAPSAASSTVSDTNFELLFSGNPYPMFVFDRESLAFLEVNAAAVAAYGYSRGEFLRMRVTDIRPAEDVPRLLEAARRLNKSPRSQDCWRHQRKNGELFWAEVTAQEISFAGRRAILAVIQDVTARRAAERKIVEHTAYLRALAENNPSAIVAIDLQRRVQMCNPAFERMFGYTLDEVRGRALESLVSIPGREAESRDLVEQILREGSICASAERRRRDGSVIDVRITGVPLVINGQPQGCFGIYEDITERKIAELRRQVSTEIIAAMGSTENLDELLAVIHGAISKALDAKNCFVALHDSVSEVFHFPLFRDQYDPPPEPQELGGSCSSYVFRTGKAELISPERFRELAALGEVKLEGTPSRSWLGVPLRTPSETIGVLVVQSYERENAYTIQDLEFLSSVGGQIAFAIERKRAEARLRESEARLRVLIEQLPAIVWTVDLDLRFTSALGAGLARLGLKPDQLVGTLLYDYFETMEPGFPPLVAHRRAAAGEPVTFHMEWKDGSYACHVEPLRDAEGTVHGAICMALDVTDRRRLEEQFRQAQKMEAVGRLAGGIAHDFNNLLMVIQGYADLLAERLPAGDSLRRSAEQIQTAGRRAASLTQQLLAFSRKQMLAPQVINIHSVVVDTENILRRLIGEDIELNTSTDRDLWLVKADRSQIEQVIMNLAVNARDAMPHGGRLTIETTNVELDKSSVHPHAAVIPGEYVMLAVTDNGCGMDAATQAHIFEPFYTTKEKGKGTGLGLATVYGIVKQSGGYIWVYSEVGRGTTFKIYLPKIEEEVPNEILDRHVAPSDLPRGSEVVLLVEDEKGVRELAHQYLEMSGYSVIEAEDGQIALELSAMHAGPIHVLMTDVVMPGISGRELAERISRLRPGIKVLYMSGYTDQSVVHHGILESGAVLLQKPFSMASLAWKLREILATETVQS